MSEHGLAELHAVVEGLKHGVKVASVTKLAMEIRLERQQRQAKSMRQAHNKHYKQSDTYVLESKEVSICWERVAKVLLDARSRAAHAARRRGCMKERDRKRCAFLEVGLFGLCLLLWWRHLLLLCAGLVKSLDLSLCSALLLDLRGFNAAESSPNPLSAELTISASSMGSTCLAFFSLALVCSSSRSSFIIASNSGSCASSIIG